MTSKKKTLQASSSNFLIWGGFTAIFSFCVFQFSQNLLRMNLLVGNVVTILCSLLFFLLFYMKTALPRKDVLALVRWKPLAYIGLPLLLGALETVWLSLAVTKLNVRAPLAKTMSLLVLLTIFYIVTELLRDKYPGELQYRRRTQALLNRNTYVLLSMGVAAFIMVFVYFCYSMIPFGDNTILRMDLYHQYGPLFGELYDRTVHGMSFIYSWESGLGSSFLGNFFNYLSSPLNILIFLFQRENVIEAISLIVLIKATISAGSFTFYIKKSLGRQNFASAGFGLAYAFCAYFLAYYWNVMWIDAMMLFPLILLGVENIINKNKITLYTVTLTLAMFSNYYMSYTICLFVVFYFLAYYFGHYDANALALKGRISTGKKTNFAKIKHLKFVRTGFSFAGASLLSAALTAFSLLPTYFTLQATSATSGSFPKTYETYFNFFDFLANHLPGLETTIRSSGEPVLPNVYCGLAVVVLVPLYMLCRSIRTREKAMNVSLLVLLAFSFQTNFLNYIWHGFHFPNDLPYRFSFMYSFLLLVMAYRVFLHFKDIRGKDIMAVGMIAALFIVIVSKSPHKFVQDKTIPLSLLFVGIYTLVLYLMKRKTFKPIFLSLIFFAAMASEIILSSTDSYIMNQTKASFASDYQSYRSVINQLKEEDDSFYRMELCQLRARMDPCWYGYNGVSTFSSMAYESTSGMQYDLGMFGNRINSYTYHPQTPVYNAMFGIKYLIRNSRLTNVLSPDYYSEKFILSDAGLTAYENKFALPVGFSAKNTLKNWKATEDDPFLQQQELFRLATGTDGVFVPVTYNSFTPINVNDITDPLENGTFSFQKIDSASEGKVTVQLTATTDTNIYLYVSSYSAKKLQVTSNKTSLSQDIDEPYILDLGKHAVSDTIDVEIDVGAEESGTISMYAYSLDQKAFEEGYRYLKAGALEIEEATDTRITGQVTAAENGVFYTSIPYDKGWTVLVDGEKVKPYGLSDSLLGFDITKGNHTIELHYMPKGLMLGIGISAVSVLGILLYFILKNKFKEKKPASLLPEISAGTAPDTTEE